MVMMFPGEDITIRVHFDVFGEQRETYLNFRENWHKIVALSAKNVFDDLVSEFSFVNIKVEDSNDHDFLIVVKFPSSDLVSAFDAYSSWKEDLEALLPFRISFPEECLEKTTESWEIVGERVRQFYRHRDEQQRPSEISDE